MLEEMKVSIKELIKGIKFDLLEETEFFFEEKKTSEAFLKSVQKEKRVKCYTQETVLPPPLPKKTLKPLIQEPIEKLPPPLVVESIERKREDDFSDIRNFFKTHYPNTLLLNEPLGDQKKNLVIAIVTEEITPFYKSLEKALDKVFDGAEIIKREEIPLYPSLKLILGISIPLEKGVVYENNPHLKRKLWKEIKSQIGHLN
jgi:hypothetical protein